MNTVLRLLKLAFSQKETSSLRGFQSKTLENKVQVLLVRLRFYLRQKTKSLRQKKRGKKKSLKKESEEKETVEKKKEDI